MLGWEERSETEIFIWQVRHSNLNKEFLVCFSLLVFLCIDGDSDLELPVSI